MPMLYAMSLIISLYLSLSLSLSPSENLGSRCPVWIFENLAVTTRDSLSLPPSFPLALSICYLPLRFLTPLSDCCMQIFHFAVASLKSGRSSVLLDVLVGLINPILSLQVNLVL